MFMSTKSLLATDAAFRDSSPQYKPLQPPHPQPARAAATAGTARARTARTATATAIIRSISAVKPHNEVVYIPNLWRATHNGGKLWCGRGDISF